MQPSDPLCIGLFWMELKFLVSPVASHASLRPDFYICTLVHGAALWMLLHHGVLRPQANRHHGVRRTAS